MRQLSRIFAGVIGAAQIFAAVAVGLMMLHITADVIGKYLFNTPLPGTIAIVSNYYMVAVVFLPLAFAEQRGLHISVEVLMERAPLWLQRIGWALALALSGAVFFLLAWRGYEEAERKRGIAAFIIEQDVRIDTWPAFFLMPIGAGLMTLVVAARLVSALAGRDGPPDKSDQGVGPASADGRADDAC